ncbi:MAG: CocE/NonD family hydrolase [Mycobacterium sp.]
MKIISQLFQRGFKLDPPDTRDVIVEQDLHVPMADGVELLADRWRPRHGGVDLPTFLIRTPYGRAGTLASAFWLPLAERGYQVLVQSTRGTAGSGGDFDPMRQEREDGLATLDWLIAQPWCGQSIVLGGASYLGYVQWAVADALPHQVKAMIPQFTESALTLEFLRADGMSLETPFRWGIQVDGQERRFAILRSLLGGRKTTRAMSTLPLNHADEAAAGHGIDYVQDVLVHDADSPRWAGCDHRHRVTNTSAPVSSVAGWYDIFLPGQLRDFHILQQARTDCRLTVGPWTHISVDGTGIREAIGFGLAHARGQQPAARAPVRLYVMGADSWRDFKQWPPAGYTPQRFHLHAEGLLAASPPGDSPPDTYRYHPSDPTPAVGGVRLSGGAGKVDNTELEARADVLTYTTPALAEAVEVIGEVSAQIWFESSQPSADVFVRLCDVDALGRSYNVCDGLVTVREAQQISCATVQLWPTAYQFQRGHRIRIQVSSGAFPRYARNSGTGEPRATDTVLRAADQAVHHDPEHASAVLLPVRTLR